MVPALFLPLESLPLTPNGKVDRRALPAPGSERPKLTRSYVAPRTAIEELIAQEWRAVLKIDRVGAHDNFFDLGGHSLLAMSIAGRLRAHFHVELPLRKLFEAADRRRPSRGDRVPAAKPQRSRNTAADRAGPAGSADSAVVRAAAAVVSSQGRARSDGLQYAGGLPYPWPLHLSALERALGEMVKRHESLRTALGRDRRRTGAANPRYGAGRLPVVDLTDESPQRKLRQKRHVWRTRTLNGLTILAKRRSCARSSFGSATGTTC